MIIFFGNIDESDDENKTTLTIPGGTFYVGTLHAHDGAKVRVYAALAPDAEIDRGTDSD